MSNIPSNPTLIITTAVLIPTTEATPTEEPTPTVVTPTEEPTATPTPVISEDDQTDDVEEEEGVVNDGDEGKNLEGYNGELNEEQIAKIKELQNKRRII